MPGHAELKCANGWLDPRTEFCQDGEPLGSCPAIIGGKRGVGQSTELGQSRSRRGWLDADVIIDGIAEPLFTIFMSPSVPFF
jgi:hypothetical protein